MKGTDAEAVNGLNGEQSPAGVAIAAAVIRGEEERPDRWGQVVSEREREVARGRCWAAGTGEVGPGLGRFGRFRPVRPFPPFFFLTATFFPISVFSN